MTRTTVNIDHDLVELARHELGTTGMNDTLEAALRQIVQRSAERRFHELLAESLRDVDDVDAWRKSRWRGKGAV